VTHKNACVLTNDPEVVSVKMDGVIESESSEVLDNIDCPSGIGRGDFDWLHVVLGWKDRLAVVNSEHCWVGPV